MNKKKLVEVRGGLLDRVLQVGQTTEKENHKSKGIEKGSENGGNEKTEKEEETGRKEEERGREERRSRDEGRRKEKERQGGEKEKRYREKTRR
jgi:hypothetical protein